MTDTSYFPDMLRSKQAELEHRLRPDSYANQDMQVDYAADELDNIIERQRRESAIGEIERNNVMLRQVKMALKRIDEGIFGICFECEEQIPDRRLKAIPWAERCVKCQELLDSQRKNVLGDTLEDLS
jgi:DnaK suppressor protein